MNQVIRNSLGRSQATALQFGTMFLVSRVLSQRSLSDRAWIKSVVLTLVGFAAYHMVVENLVNTNGLNKELKSIVDTWLKVGTMLVVSRVLAGGSLRDQTWIQSSLMTLVGFNAYNILTSKLISCEDKTGVARRVCDNTLNVGTMLAVSRIMSNGSLADPAWMKESFMTLLGFAVYDVFVARH